VQETKHLHEETSRSWVHPVASYVNPEVLDKL